MIATPALVTLTTDFGTDDTFVGEMKGAILALCPRAVIVDLTHAVPPHDIRAGAFLLACGSATFPEGALHVAVVDPGVGTARRAIGARTERGVFLAPDNGLLTRVLRREPARAIRELRDPRFRRPVVSGTFEGRDVFAPAAAHLLLGVPLERFGPDVPDPVLLDLPARWNAAGAPGSGVEVVLVDRFGNVVLDLDAGEVAAADRSGIVFVAPRGEARGLYRTYGDGPPAGAFAVVNGAGWVELAVREGRAAESLGLRPGDVVGLRIGGDVV